MPTTSLLLVLVSAALHAWWNFLIKRAGGGTAFVGLSKVAEVVLFAPAFLLWALPGAGALVPAWPVVLGGAVLTLANYAALGRAYQLGDLSVVYPVARGATLLFLPLLGWMALGERVSGPGGAALLCIIAGIAAVQLPSLSRSALAALGRSLAEPAVALALVAALAAAGYTVWDKRAVQTLPAFAYFYAYSALVGLAYAAFLLRRYPLAELREEWRRHRWAIVQVAVGNTVAYLLVLLALRSGTSSYVIALRQLSIAIGAMLGWRLLAEPFGAPRRLGIALIVGGCLLLAALR